jgi:hypothetical protein
MLADVGKHREGLRAAGMESDQSTTDQAVADAKVNHFWNQPDSAAQGSKFEYTK